MTFSHVFFSYSYNTIAIFCETTKEQSEYIYMYTSCGIYCFLYMKEEIH